MTQQVKSSCGVVGRLPCCNLPGTAGEQSSPVFHKSISNSLSGILHQVPGSLRVGVQSVIHD